MSASAERSEIKNPKTGMTLAEMKEFILEILPSLKGPKGRGFLLVPRQSGDTFGGFLTRRAYLTRRRRAG